MYQNLFSIFTGKQRAVIGAPDFIKELEVTGDSLLSSDAPCSRRDLRGNEIPSEIQYVAVLIKSVFPGCELLKHAYLKPSCLIGCVSLGACLLCMWAILFGNVHVRIAVIIRVNRSSVGEKLRKLLAYLFLNSSSFSFFVPSACRLLRNFRCLGCVGGGSLHRLHMQTPPL